MEPDLVLAEAAALALATGTRMVDPRAHELACAEAGVGHEQWYAALGALRAADLIALQTFEPSGVLLLAVTNAGLHRHLRATRHDLGAIKRRLAAAVIDAAGRGATPLADVVGEPALLVECLLDQWVGQRKVVYSKAPGRRFRVHKLGPAPLPGAAAPAPEPAPGEPAPSPAQP